MEEDSFNSALKEAIEADNTSQIQSLLNDLEWVDVAVLMPIIAGMGVTQAGSFVEKSLWV